jgi:RNA polymerase sigma factor (sigma-70 family)
METPSLEALAKELRAMRKPFDELIEEYRKPLWRYCLRLTGSIWDAEDLVQETLTKAFARLVSFWQPLDPKPYLFRIATNAWIDTLRRTQPLTVDLDVIPEVADTAPDPGEPWGAMETVIDLLPPRQRVILLLIEVFAFTAPEVAAMLSLTEGAVRAALHRARATLRQQRTSITKEGGAVRRVPNPAVVTRFMDAFNRRDIEAIASLLDEGASTAIVGIAEEQGREFVLKYSMKDGFAMPEEFVAELGLLSGREVLCIYFRTPVHERALGWVMEVTTAGERVTGLKGYWFTPEFLEAAAAELGVPAYTHGYTF